MQEYDQVVFVNESNPMPRLAPAFAHGFSERGMGLGGGF
jgi:hypothetical protein